MGHTNANGRHGWRIPPSSISNNLIDFSFIKILKPPLVDITRSCITCFQFIAYILWINWLSLTCLRSHLCTAMLRGCGTACRQSNRYWSQGYIPCQMICPQGYESFRPAALSMPSMCQDDLACPPSDSLAPATDPPSSNRNGYSCTFSLNLHLYHVTRSQTRLRGLLQRNYGQCRFLFHYANTITLRPCSRGQRVIRCGTVMRLQWPIGLLLGVVWTTAAASMLASLPKLGRNGRCSHVHQPITLWINMSHVHHQPRQSTHGPLEAHFDKV